MNWLLRGLIGNLVALYIVFVFCANLIAADKITDLDRISRNLKKKEEELLKKEAALKKKEEELRLLEKILSEKEKEIDAKLNKLIKLYEDIKKIQDEDLDKLAKYYASTNPKSAAKIISKMELKKAVQLFKRMSPMAAGGILSQLGKIDPVKASKISEAMTPKDINFGEIK
ncbi:MotE family protein [Deferribacter abyssi]|uniref:MotE family protein n=1 Tax=Deferribacter abyssi TaxID=213806 RepID=UPI003C1D87A8